METTKLNERTKEIKLLIDEVIDLDQCDALREDIKAADISEADKCSLNAYLSLVEGMIVISNE